MMKTIIVGILFISYIFVISITPSIAQSNEVKFKFERDGKVIKQNFKVFLYIDGVEFEAKTSKDSFFIPLEVQGRDYVAVRFISKKYNLYFNPIFTKDFKADWTIGIDNKPFENENINTSLSYDNVCSIHYVSFSPKGGGIATRLIMRIENTENP